MKWTVSLKLARYFEQKLVSQPMIYSCLCYFVLLSTMSQLIYSLETHTPKRNFVTLHFKNLRLMDVSVAAYTVCMNVTLIKLHVIWSVQNAILYISHSLTLSVCICLFFFLSFIHSRFCVPNRGPRVNKIAFFSSPSSLGWADGYMLT